MCCKLITILFPQIIAQLKEDFEKMWEAGEVPGWPKDTSSALSNTGAPLDLSGFSSVEELASLGLDRLKSALIALGLKCGGSLEERAGRLWKTKGKTLDEVDPTLFAKKKGGIASDINKQKEIAFWEVQIYKFVDLLDEQVRLHFICLTFINYLSIHSDKTLRRMFSESRHVPRANARNRTMSRTSRNPKMSRKPMSSIILRICPWAGMASQYLIGSTNCTD